MSPFDALSRRSVRAAAVSSPFPLGGVLPSTASAEGKPSLFGRVHVHRSAVAFMNRPGLPVRTRMRLPRFRAKNLSTCTRSPTARGSSDASHSPWDDVAFSSTEGDRHLGIRPVSQLNTWPVVSPVSASRRPSRDAAHHSRSGRMASPYPMGDFHLLFFASFPGALRVGSFASISLGAGYFRSSPMSGHSRCPSACRKSAINGLPSVLMLRNMRTA